MTTITQTTSSSATTRTSQNYSTLPLGEGKTPSATDRTASIAPQVIANSVPPPTKVELINMPGGHRGILLTFESMEDQLLFHRAHFVTTFVLNDIMKCLTMDRKETTKMVIKENRIKPNSTILKALIDIWGLAKLRTIASFDPLSEEANILNNNQNTFSSANTTTSQNYSTLPTGESKTPSATDRTADIAPQVIANAVPPPTQVEPLADGYGVLITFGSIEDRERFCKAHSFTTFQTNDIMNFLTPDLEVTTKIVIEANEISRNPAILKALSTIWGSEKLSAIMTFDPLSWGINTSYSNQNT